MRIALGIEYDGSAYNGWQVQPDRPTVQQALEEALARFAGDGAPVPTIKIASNTSLASRKPNWIDYNAGSLLEDPDLDKAGLDFFHHILETASGKKTRNEINGYREIAIWKDGVTL